MLGLVLPVDKVNVYAVYGNGYSYEVERSLTLDTSNESAYSRVPSQIYNHSVNASWLQDGLVITSKGYLSSVGKFLTLRDYALLGDGVNVGKDRLDIQIGNTTQVVGFVSKSTSTSILASTIAHRLLTEERKQEPEEPLGVTLSSQQSSPQVMSNSLGQVGQVDQEAQELLLLDANDELVVNESLVNTNYLVGESLAMISEANVSDVSAENAIGISSEVNVQEARELDYLSLSIFTNLDAQGVLTEVQLAYLTRPVDIRDESVLLVYLGLNVIDRNGRVVGINFANIDSSDLANMSSNDLVNTSGNYLSNMNSNTLSAVVSTGIVNMDKLDPESETTVRISTLPYSNSSLIASSSGAYGNVTSQIGKTSVDTSAGSCVSSNLLSAKLMTDICWDCILPIQISGVAVTGNKDDIPKDAVKDQACKCERKAQLPQIGYTLGFWKPVRLVELVRTPGCLMALNGVKTSIGRPAQIGTRGTGERDLTNQAFYHYHYYAFPLLQILGLINRDICMSNEFTSIDVLYISEIDPTWNYPEIAQLTFPETKLFANEAAVLACGADAIASLMSKNGSNLYWCAGTWGTLYPISGFAPGVGSGAQITSLLATRSLAASHRRGFEYQTVGKQALCKLHTNFKFVAQQYRFSMIYPMPQDSKHPIGRSTFLWGEASGAEDAIYVVYRWKDCCSAFL
ncbi:TraU family protein [Psittacicella hinzii]|uniref:TraU family protein n=1 Tax=Psittacicella hinzii TaxID=2028575 RepID=UPI001CA7684F|nr:TraU family protein [Psittacicella hinzii]